MEYNQVLAQVLDLLQRERRLSYRVLKRRFQLDDDLLEALKEDLIYAKQLAVDEDGRVLVWRSDAGAILTPSTPPGQVADGLRLLAEALAIFETSGRGDMLAEAYRLQGELLLRQDTPDATQAEACI